ncbi:MAG: SpoIIE family protein phosphatase [Clostridia bacterium]|nr:SpoIIE family protein phosphatase [Clostridia bacterium]
MKIGDISVGRIFGIVLILASADYFGIAGGSISGISVGIIFGFTNPSFNFLAGSYSFAGMISGLAAKYGKLVTVASFIISSLVITMQTNDMLSIIISVYELFFASFLFLFIPDALINKVCNLVYPYDPKVSDEFKIDDGIIFRLKYIANSLKNVTESINKVSQKLIKNKSKPFAEFYLDVKKNVCDHCGLKTLCWETKKQETATFFDNVAEILKDNNKEKKDEFIANSLNKCHRFLELETHIKKAIKETRAKDILLTKNNELRGIIAEQFSEMSDILTDISKDFSGKFDLDTQLADKIAEVLKENSIFPLSVVCTTDKSNRSTIELNIPHMKQERLINLNLHKLVSKECSKILQKPLITTTQKGYNVKLIEKPKFKLQIGACQHVCHNGIWCGDNFNYFDDGNGNMVFVLSDGMGTGGMAAIEGALACEILSDLIKSGMNIETALKITNSALLLKSTDESLAAIDVVFVNLYTGQVNFIKAGAAASFIKTSEKTQKIELSSLPIGIFKNINFFSQIESINNEDWILILSDGAIFPDDKWIQENLQDNKFLDPQNLAEDIVSQAIKNRSDDYDDDITTIAIKVSLER